MFGSSTRTTIQNKHQNKHKNGSLSTKWIFYHGCPCPLTWTLQKMSEVNWREEAPSWSCESEDLERFCMKKMVSDLLSMFSKLFRPYMRKLRAVTLVKGRCNNWVPIIVANMNKGKHLFHKEIFPLLQLFYFNNRLECCALFKWKIKRINNADLFSQSPLLIFTNGANISGEHCKYPCFLLCVCFGYRQRSAWRVKIRLCRVWRSHCKKRLNMLYSSLNSNASITFS